MNISRKDNNLIEDINNKDIFDRKEEKKISPKSNFIDLAEIVISTLSVNQINYNKINQLKWNKSFKRAKSFNIVDYTKSIIFKQAKKNYHYLTLFRKHLLSEEHLLKSHVNFVLLEKKYKLNDEETTNIFECYNKL